MRITRTASRLIRILRAELGPLHPRLLLAALFVRLLPQLAFQRLRAAIYRTAGITIGSRSLIAGSLSLVGPGPISSRLTIGSHCYLNAPIFFDLTGPIVIGDRVTVGHHVTFITAQHTIGPPARRAGPTNSESIVIGKGAWIGADVTLLPGSSVGSGSVVGAGSLVVGEIPSGVLAVGRPARVLRDLSRHDEGALREVRVAG